MGAISSSRQQEFPAAQACVAQACALGPCAMAEEQAKCATSVDACSSSTTPLTELFDLVAECGAMREIDAVRYIHALIPLCEACVRAHPTFRLAPELIMIAKDGSVSLRACTVGTNAVEPGATARPVEAFSPPEAALGEEAASGLAAATAWALGIVLFSLLAGYPPFAKARQEDCSYFKAFVESNQIHFPHFFSKNAVELLCGLLARSPSSRFTFKQALRHLDVWLEQLAADAAGSPPSASAEANAAQCAEGRRTAEGRPLAPPLSCAGNLIENAGSQKRPFIEVLMPPSVSADDTQYALPKAIFNSPRSEWPRQRDLSLLGSHQPTTMIRHLGWDGLRQPIDELFQEVMSAVHRIDVPVSMVYSSEERPRALLTKMHHVNDNMGDGLMAAEVWIVRTSGEQYGICVKRASGDTFQFHAFYRLLRDALAKTTGWSGSEYNGSVVPGVLPILWRRARRVGPRPTSRCAALPVA